MAVIHLVQADCSTHNGAVGRNCRQRLKVQISVEILSGSALVAHIELAAIVFFGWRCLRHKIGDNIILNATGCNQQRRVDGHGQCPARLLNPGTIRRHRQDITVLNFIQCIGNMI